MQIEITDIVKSYLDEINIEEIIKSILNEQLRRRIEEAIVPMIKEVTKESIKPIIEVRMQEIMAAPINISDGYSGKHYKSFEEFFKLEMQKALSSYELKSAFLDQARNELVQFVKRESADITNVVTEQILKLVKAKVEPRVS